MSAFFSKTVVVDVAIVVVNDVVVTDVHEV